MERSVEILAVVQFFIVGFSHALRPHAWIDLFTRLHDRGHAGVFVHGFLSLGMGSLILGFHNVWTGIPAMLTLVGYLYTFKATMCFVFPETQMKTLGRVSHERPHELAIVGLVYIVVASVLSYSLWAR
jgi:hypothetical protein